MRPSRSSRLPAFSGKPLNMFSSSRVCKFCPALVLATPNSTSCSARLQVPYLSSATIDPTFNILCVPADSAARSVFADFTQRPLLSLVGDRSFIAVGDDDWAETARSFPGVLTVQQRSAVGKISPHLKAILDKPSLSPLKIISHCFPGPGCISAARLIESASQCELYSHYDSIELRGAVAEVRNAVEILAGAPGVHWLELKTNLKPRNYAGSSIIGTGVSQTSLPIPSQVLSSITLDPSSIIAVAGTVPFASRPPFSFTISTAPPPSQTVASIATTVSSAALHRSAAMITLHHLVGTSTTTGSCPPPTAVDAVAAARGQQAVWPPRPAETISIKMATAPTWLEQSWARASRQPRLLPAS
jgi:hypothetical protein